MFDRTGGRAASAESARRRLELLSVSLAGDFPRGRDSDDSPPLTPQASAPGGSTDSVAGDSAADPVAGESAGSDTWTDSSGGGRGKHAARPLPRTERVSAGLADRVPVPVRAAWSTRLTGHHLAVLAVLVAALLCLAAWWALSARPQVQAMPQMAPAPSAVAPTGAPSPPPGASPGSPQSPAGPSPTPPGPSQSPAEPVAGGEVVVVDVAGRVRQPGIVTLPIGSRVADALAAAGGTRGGVDLTTLNLARVLLDGEQLLVGIEAAVPPLTALPSSTAPPGLPGAPGAPTALVNLNTATAADLDTLPGVGPVTAQAILDWRTERGGFTAVDELLEVSGIGEVTLEELRPLVTV